MSRIKWFGYFILAPLFLNACGTFVEVVNVNELPAEVRAETYKVRVFQAYEPRSIAYDYVSPIEATSCKNLVTDPPATTANAMEQLKYKAHRIGANGVAGVSCTRTGVDYGSNCWQSVVCSGTAIKISRSYGDDDGESGDSSGSGFFINRNGNVLTNAHVVAKCDQIRIRLSGKIFDAWIVGIDEANDLAVLRTGHNTVAFLTFGKETRPRLSEEIIVLGYPLQSLLSNEVHATSGDITALSGIRNDSRLIQISAPVQTGNSGGPVVDRLGNVVGVTVSKLNAIAVAGYTGDIPQNVNFAIKASIVLNFLKSHSVSFSTQPSRGILKKPDLVEKIGPAIVPVQCIRS